MDATVIGPSTRSCDWAIIPQATRPPACRATFTHDDNRPLYLCEVVVGGGGGRGCGRVEVVEEGRKFR